MADSFEYKDMGLANLIKALSEKAPTAKVGILGDSDSRAGQEQVVTKSGTYKKLTGKKLEDAVNKSILNETVRSNATIGARHEFNGRSFLRQPISENLQKYLESSGAFDKKAFRQVVKTKSLLPWVKKLGILGVQIVNEAFDTGGFGKWKPSNMDNKIVKQTLVETQQLRNSITSQVDE